MFPMFSEEELAKHFQNFTNSEKVIAIIDFDNTTLGNTARTFFSLKDVASGDVKVKGHFVFRTIVPSSDKRLGDQLNKRGQVHLVEFNNEEDETLLTALEGCYGLFVLAYQNPNEFFINKIAKAARITNLQHVIWCSDRETETNSILITSRIPVTFLMVTLPQSNGHRPSEAMMPDLAKFSINIFQHPYDNMFKRVVYTP